MPLDTTAETVVIEPSGPPPHKICQTESSKNPFLSSYFFWTHVDFATSVKLLCLAGNSHDRRPTIGQEIWGNLCESLVCICTPS